MLDFIRSKITGATDELSAVMGRAASRELMQAVVANVCAFAHADGTYGDDEKKVVGNILTKHPVMLAYYRDSEARKKEAFAKFNELASAFAISPDIGFADCEKELADIAGIDAGQRHVVMAMGLAVGKAEAGLGTEETAWARVATRALALDPERYGLSGE